MANKGWIKLHRQIQDCWIWRGEPFSKGQAWVDILLLANHEDRKIAIDGKPVVIKTGSFHTSTYKLADRWGWDKRKVSRFLNCLERDGMLTQKRSFNGTTITIENYGKFQDIGTTDGTTDGTANSTTDGTTDGTQTRIKELKNERIKEDKREDIPYQQIADTYNSICKSYPRLTTVSDTRKKAIRARLNSGYTIDDFTKAFEMAEASDFLKGKNDRNWSATFDWMIKDSNMAKILDGNYENKKGGGRSERAEGNAGTHEDAAERKMREFFDS